MTVRKRFGQHFLERTWVAKVIAAVAPTATDIFLEIGPGRGALTGGLVASGARVHAVEIDRDLARDLRDGAPANLQVIDGDFLQLPTSSWWDGAQPYRVAANLPYNVSTPIVIRLLADARAGVLSDATLMVQREVADRMAAAPGTADYGPLAIAVGLGADIRRLFVLPPGAFRPPPAVQSALVFLRFRPAPVEIADRPAFDALVRHLFTQRRKTLGRALRPLADARGMSAHDWLESAGLSNSVRAETLPLESLARLAAAMPQTPA